MNTLLQPNPSQQFFITTSLGRKPKEQKVENDQLILSLRKKDLSLHGLWQEHQLLGDSANVDFVTIPYWGEAEHLENNWSATRNKALSSILAVLAQDPDTGIITYGDSNIRHSHKQQVLLEFLDFYRANGQDNLNNFYSFPAASP